MKFNKYMRLKRLALKRATVGAFIEDIVQDSWWYGVPLWNKEHYRWFYEKVKGGYKYVDLVNSAV